MTLEQEMELTGPQCVDLLTKRDIRKLWRILATARDRLQDHADGKPVKDAHLCPSRKVAKLMSDEYHSIWWLMANRRELRKDSKCTQLYQR